MPDSLPRLVEVAGPNGTTRAHLHFWLQRPDGLWGGLRREDSIPDDMQGFGSKAFSWPTVWYAHEPLISTVPGYETRPVPPYTKPRSD